MSSWYDTVDPYIANALTGVQNSVGQVAGAPNSAGQLIDLLAHKLGIYQGQNALTRAFPSADTINNALYSASGATPYQPTTPEGQFGQNLLTAAAPVGPSLLRAGLQAAGRLAPAAAPRGFPAPGMATDPQLIAETAAQAERMPLAPVANPRLTDNSFRAYGDLQSNRYAPSPMGPGYSFADATPTQRWKAQTNFTAPERFLAPDYGETPMGVPMHVAEDLSQFRPGSDAWKTRIDTYKNQFGYKADEAKALMDAPIKTQVTNFLQPHVTMSNYTENQKIVQNLQRLQEGKQSVADAGASYATTINHNPEHFFDWSKPLSQQTQQIQDAFPGVSGNFNGEQLLEHLGNPTGAAIPLSEVHANAALAMRDAGIPGVKYPANPLYPAEPGNLNYVVYDPKMISVIRKFGLPGMIAGGAMTIGGNADAANHFVPEHMAAPSPERKIGMDITDPNGQPIPRQLFPGLSPSADMEGLVPNYTIPTWPDSANIPKNRPQSVDDLFGTENNAAIGQPQRDSGFTDMMNKKQYFLDFPHFPSNQQDM